ncbi:hypothetical protein RCL1_008573 [Eukaryota sp. TZLM3-RCL]
MQKWNLHIRISLLSVIKAGGDARKIMFALGLTCFVLSCFMHNTAVIGNAAIILRALDPSGTNETIRYKYGKVLFLVVAWSSTIGGTSTLIGTGTNLSLGVVLRIAFGKAGEENNPDFVQWMKFALPYAFILNILMLSTLYKPANQANREVRLASIADLEEGKQSGASVVDGFKDRYKKLGPASYEEKVVGICFAFAACLWVTRTSWFGFGSGWSGLFKNGALFSDATVAVAISVVFFLIPARAPNKDKSKYHRILDWKATKQLPYEMLFLFGCGFVIARVFTSSGLDLYLADKLKVLETVPLPILMWSLCQFASFVSEVTSNTSASLSILPIVAAMSRAIQVHPFMLMIPVTLACSNAYMLISATPPNSVVFGHRQEVDLQVSDMAKRGIWISLIGNVLLVSYSLLFLPRIYGISLDFPEWANVE